MWHLIISYEGSLGTGKVQKLCISYIGDFNHFGSSYMQYALPQALYVAIH